MYIHICIYIHIHVHIQTYRKDGKTLVQQRFPLISDRQMPPMKDGSWPEKKKIGTVEDFDIALFFELLSHRSSVQEKH